MLTKWVPKEKLAMSIAYMTNAKAIGGGAASDGFTIVTRKKKRKDG